MSVDRGKITGPRLLKRRVRVVLNSPRYARDAFGDVLDAVRPLGPVAIFGGLLRDLCWAPPSDALSDIDLVVSTTATSELAASLEFLAATRNRYGGLHVARGRWTFDVWPLKETWAFRAGYVDGQDFGDLIRTTFFNWDAVVFEIDTGTLHYPELYFTDLEHRLLDINLEPNANPAGNVVRAIRLLRSRRACFGPRLARYIRDFLTAALETGSVKVPSAYREYLRQQVVKNILVQIHKHLQHSPDSPYELAPIPDSPPEAPTATSRP